MKPPERVVHPSVGQSSEALPYRLSASPVLLHNSREPSGVVVTVPSGSVRETGAQKSVSVALRP